MTSPIGSAINSFPLFSLWFGRFGLIIMVMYKYLSFQAIYLWFYKNLSCWHFNILIFWHINNLHNFFAINYEKLLRLYNYYNRTLFMWNLWVILTPYYSKSDLENFYSPTLFHYLSLCFSSYKLSFYIWWPCRLLWIWSYSQDAVMGW